MNKVLGRMLVSLSVLTALLWFVDWRELLEIGRRIDAGPLALSFVVLLLGRLIMVVRWKMVLNACDVFPALGRLIYTVILSAPAAVLLPGAVGTDLVRGYLLAKASGNAMKIAASIVFDRGIGILSMMALPVVVGVATGFSGISPVIRTYTLVAGVGCVAIVLLFPIMTKPAKEVIRRCSFGSDRLRRSLLSVASFEIQLGYGVFAKLLALSVSVQGVRTLTFWLIFVALGYSIDFVQMLIYVPIVFIVVLLPISFGGLGVREAAMAVLFSEVGVPAEVSVTAGLVSHALQMLFSFPGALLLVRGFR